MKRLTYNLKVGDVESWTVEGADNLTCDEICKRQEDDGCRTCPIEKMYNRLGEIEDILGDDYDLDHLNELVKADKEGRCLILPVKSNESVYFIKSAFSMAHFPIKANCVALRVLTTDGDVWYTAITEYNHISRSFYGSDLNKTVFLTYKEAEQALKEREQNEKI